MKRINAIILALLLIMLLASCSENPGTTTMRLILSTESQGRTKTLVPSDSSLLEISKFTVSGTGPNGKTFTESSDDPSITIEGLTIGEWTVTAKGLNSKGTVLASGTSTFRLTSTANPRTIVLDTLVGTGSFSYVLDWSLCDVSHPVIDIFLTGPDMDGDEVQLRDITYNNDTTIATVTETLAAGSYKIRVILRDGETQVAGLVEALRISNGTSTTGEHTFLFNELGPDTTIYFKDATGTPIKGVLTAKDGPQSFLDGLKYTYVFSFENPSKVNTDGLSIEWYYDGNLAKEVKDLDGTGSAYETTVDYGVHRIDAVVYNKLLGSTGSSSITFTVVPNGRPGEMILINENAGSTMASLPDCTILSALPGDMFLVTCADTAKMYLCSVSSKALNVVRTMDSTTFPWLGSVKHVFSDSRSSYVIATDNYNGTESFTVLKYNSNAKTLEPVSGMRYEGKTKYSIPFTNFTSASFANAVDAIYLSDAGIYGYDYVLKIDSNGSINLGGIYKKLGSKYNNLVDMDTSENGRYWISASGASTSFVSGLINDSQLVMSFSESQPADGAPSRLRFVNNQNVVAATASELTTYKVVGNGTYTKNKVVGIAVNDLEADGLDYFYIADNSRRIVSFKANGYEIEQIGMTMIEDYISDICLSGKYLAAFTDSNRIALFQVIE